MAVVHIGWLQKIKFPIPVGRRPAAMRHISSRVGNGGYQAYKLPDGCGYYYIV